MTLIEPVPQLRLSSRFPTNADRPSGQWNAVVVEWGETTRTMATDLNLLAQNVLNNAKAGREQAEAAQASNDAAKEQADRSRDEANRSRDEAELSMDYRNTAGQHAGAAATHAGTAATKAGEAAASVQLAGEHKQQALQAVEDAQEQVTLASQQAARAETAAASIADGPITSLQVHSGPKTGAVTLGLADLGPKATDAQMVAGALADPLLMSPAGVKAAVLAHAPKTLPREARTANTQLVKADSGKLIDITSGTFTQTLAAAAALGDGWWFYLKNSGTGDLAVQTDDPKTENLFPKDWNGTSWVPGEKSATTTNTSQTLSGNVLTVGRSYVITFTVSNKSGSTIQLRANSGAVSTAFISTNGTYSLTVPSATSGTLSFICSGALTVTISNVIIEDKSPLIMYPGETRLVVCDGSQLLTSVITGFSKAFTTSGSFIRPPGYSAFGILAWKGGNGGQAGYTAINTSGTAWKGGRGGDGSPVYRGVLSFDAFRPGNPVVIGAGGVKGIASTTSNGLGTVPGGGGDTSVAGSVFSTLNWPFYIAGGIGAVPITNSNPNNPGITTPDAVDALSDAGAPGGGGGTCTAISASAGFRAGYAGSLGGWNALGSRGGKGGDAASCTWGVTPILWLEPAAGEDGQAPGGGGGGGGCGYYHSATEYRYGKDGGNGARGELRIWGVI